MKGRGASGRFVSDDAAADFYAMSEGQRMDYGTRGTVTVRPPVRKKDVGVWGTSRVWGRRINGRPYSFEAVKMPDGERRYFVSRYNGYGSGEGTPDDLKWGCAWSPHFAFIVAPDGTIRRDPFYGKAS